MQSQLDSPLIATLRVKIVARIVLPFAFGYFLSYFLRAVNAIIAPDLTADIGLDAQALGLLTSVYFLTFAICQLPLGMLLDRFGARRTETCLLLIAALGAIIFASATNFTQLLIARALIGIGVSACLMAAFQSFTQWFAAERLPLINALQMTAGGLGALSATQPLHWLLAITDWRGVFWGLGGLCIIAAGLILTVPKRPVNNAKLTVNSAAPKNSPAMYKTHNPESWRGLIGGIRTVFTDTAFRAIAPWAALAQGSSMAILGLWCGPWLIDVAGLDREIAAMWLAAAAAASVVGYILFGWLADRLRPHNISPMHIAGGGLLISLLPLGLLTLPLSGSWPWVWIPFAFCTSAGILTYAVLSQRFAAALAGRVNTALNVLVFGASFIIQWGIGAVIDLWPPIATGHFAPPGYQVALLGILGLQIISAIWFFVRYRHI